MVHASSGWQREYFDKLSPSLVEGFWGGGCIAPTFRFRLTFVVSCYLYLARLQKNIFKTLEWDTDSRGLHGSE